MTSRQDILSRRGLSALRSLGAGRVLLAFDFDGTIAPLARHPKLVRVPPPVRRQLRALAALAPVAVVSGRSLADLRRFFPRFRGFLIGNHGAEGLPLGRNVLRSARRASRAWSVYLARGARLATAAHGPRDRRPRADIWLEDKTYSLTVHCRSAAALRAFRRHLEDDAPRILPPMRLLTGKASLNLLPSSIPNKGRAIALLLRRVRAMRGLFVGDDETDEDVFSAAGKHLITVRVGRPRRTRAAFLLRRQGDIGRLLAVLVDCAGTGRR